MATKRIRTSKHLSPLSSDTDLKTSIISATKVASNQDLLTQILLNLPIKSLICFKSISKLWLSLLTSPHFICLRNPLPLSASALFFCSSSSGSNLDYHFIPLDDDDNGSLTTAPFKTLGFVHDPLGSGVCFLQSCNGLLLCACYRQQESIHRYYVYNPTTKEFTNLPQIRHEYAKYVCGMSLAFDPSVSPHYKVICVRHSQKSSKLVQIEIYSSETKLWRVSGQPFIPPQCTAFETCVYWNSSIHWWNRLVDSSLWSNDPYTLYFKVDEERLDVWPMPMNLVGMNELNEQEGEEDEEELEKYGIASYLGDSEGHFHLIEVYNDCNGLFSVYEMAGDYSGWFVKYEVDLNVACSVFPDINMEGYNFKYDSKYRFNILALVRRERGVDDSFLVLELPGGKIIRYNFVDKSVKKLQESAPTGYEFRNEEWLRSVNAFQYMESLVRV